MKQFECRYCQHTIQFGVDVKGVGEIADFIRRHEETCIANDEPIVLPIAVRKLKHGNKRLLKLTGTIFSPGECLNSIKEAASNLRVIGNELSDPEMENSAGMLGDLIRDFEESLKQKYIFA